MAYYYLACPCWGKQSWNQCIIWYYPWYAQEIPEENQRQMCCGTRSRSEKLRLYILLQGAVRLWNPQTRMCRHICDTSQMTLPIPAGPRTPLLPLFSLQRTVKYGLVSAATSTRRNQKRHCCQAMLTGWLYSLSPWDSWWNWRWLAPTTTIERILKISSSLPILPCTSKSAWHRLNVMINWPEL